ncbi:class I SAM-dependent methyltransferase [Bacteroides gallinarum]|uniref:class I SAM-dependent methyltransferase n=1 Tax=Bacteroides gallinarum TaxID=376806 RepID=UPI00036CD1B9|nr:class I SAM-dependent methyltransferase [Bacteroides gallinarum]
MTLTEETLRFIREHRKDDVRNLALQARKYPTVDMPAAITQIAGRQAAEKKVPTWAGREDILYPAHLSMEQCSSEATARYKAEVVLKSTDSDYETFTDLTGGFGIDCAFLSACFKRTTYVECQEILCEIAAHNFPLLGLEHITVCHEDSIRYLQTMPPVDWIFIDPARRDGHGGKTVAVNDCEPNVSSLEETLLGKARHVLVKLSPMLDLTLALHDLKHVQAAHIVSVNNECKELLLVLERTADLSADEIPIHCVNLTASQTSSIIRFTRQQEKEYPCPYTSTLKTYLYEPNASILKAGAFHNISHIYKVEKLHPNSHLYTSNEYIPDFPGRKFRITGSGGLNKKELQALAGTEKKANLTIRNFPASVAELRKRLKLAEGGDTYLFATTLADKRKLLIACKPPTADGL